MRKFVIRILLFSMIFVVFYLLLFFFVLPIGVENANGPTTKQQIEESFKDILTQDNDLIILGNSGVYRGVNPDFIEMNSYNFAHDNDSYNQIYYKLLWLNKNKVNFKYLVLGVDYFQFSFLSGTRNYIYNSYFNKSYEEDFLDIGTVEAYLDRSQILKLERLKYLRNVFSKKSTTILHKKNGQYVKPGVAKKDDSHYYSIHRLKLQEEYFERIIKYCKDENIEVFLCMLPVRENALKNYQKEDIDKFDKYIMSFTNEKIHYLNFSLQGGWTLKDYTDVTHLNEKASNRFTIQLNDSIYRIINTIP